MITRSNPDVGYIADETFQTYAFTQNIRAGNTLYLSGVTPLKGDLENVEVVGAGDMRAQVAQTLEIVKRCLAAEGATFKTGSPRPSIPRTRPTSFAMLLGSTRPLVRGLRLKASFCLNR